MPLRISSTALTQFWHEIHEAHGFDFRDYSEDSIKRRIVHFMNEKKIADLEHLQAKILVSESFFEEFIQEMSVTVTEMFRDEKFFKALREKVIPRLATYPFIKVWLAGCATGEEAYSIAILLDEAGLSSRSLIYATDINQRSLQIAKEGLYPKEKMDAASQNYMNSGGTGNLEQYYLSKYNSVIFTKNLKQNLVFSPHNLAVDRSFNEFQLILCRNVLIYFKQNLQNKVINLFYDSLCPFGFLALGNKETILFCDRNKSFDEVDRREKIYLKTG